jgi:hypothetical protein
MSITPGEGEPEAWSVVRRRGEASAKPGWSDGRHEGSCGRMATARHDLPRQPSAR